MHRQKEMQIGLTADEEQQLEGVTLQQLLAAFRAESFEFSRGMSAYRGVTFCKSAQKFKAQIRVSSKQVNLGCYENEEEAAHAYDRAAFKQSGRWSLLSYLNIAGSCLEWCTCSANSKLLTNRTGSHTHGALADLVLGGCHI